MILLNNYIYDLSIKTDRNQLSSTISDLVYDYAGQNDCDYETLESLLADIDEYINNQDESSLNQSDIWEYDINLTVINESELLYNALANAGYTVQNSNISSSLYAINDNGQEVRISDHKRPAVEQNGIYTEHEEGLIIDSIDVNSNIIINEGFSNLEDNKVLYLW